MVLFGSETGVAEICHQFGLLHVPQVKVNEFGTPLLNDIFRRVEAVSDSDLFCYVNADIILRADFMAALATVSRRKSRFFMGARPWNLDITESLQFTSSWEQRLAEGVQRKGDLRSERSCDFFAFSRGLWVDLPPFAVGRAYFDNALLFLARKIGAALVDATPSVTSVHQNHGYATHLNGVARLTNLEARQNVQIAGGGGKLLTWKSSTYVLENGRLKRNFLGLLRFFGPWSNTAKGLRQVLGCISPIRDRLQFRRP